MYGTLEINTIASFLFTNSHFKNIELKSSFRCGSPSFIWFLFPPWAWLLSGMQISFTNLWRAVDLRTLSIRETLGLVTESPGLITEEKGETCWFSGSYVQPRVVVRCFRVPLDHLLRFHTVPKCEVPFVEGTYFLEQTCSVIYLFIFSF